VFEFDGDGFDSLIRGSDAMYIGFLREFRSACNIVYIQQIQMTC